MRPCALRAAGVKHHVCCPGDQVDKLGSGEVSDMVKVHRLYPLGIECAHCERWHRLKDAIEHAEEFHPDCEYCGMEAMLARSLMSEAVSALDQVRRRVPVDQL